MFFIVFLLSIYVPTNFTLEAYQRGSDVMEIFLSKLASSRGYVEFLCSLCVFRCFHIIWCLRVAYKVFDHCIFIYTHVNLYSN